MSFGGFAWKQLGGQGQTVLPSFPAGTTPSTSTRSVATCTLRRWLSCGRRSGTQWKASISESLSGNSRRLEKASSQKSLRLHLNHQLLTTLFVSVLVILGICLPSIEAVICYALRTRSQCQLNMFPLAIFPCVLSDCQVCSQSMKLERLF